MLRGVINVPNVVVNILAPVFFVACVVSYGRQSKANIAVLVFSVAERRVCEARIAFTISDKTLHMVRRDRAGAEIAFDITQSDFGMLVDYGDIRDSIVRGSGREFFVTNHDVEIPDARVSNVERSFL